MTKNGGVPARTEIADKYKWDVASIYADDSQWEEDYARVGMLAEKIGGYHGRLGEGARVLLECLQLRDQLLTVGGKVIVYANLRRDEDTAAAKYQALADRARSLAVKLQTALSFLQPELLALPAGVVEGFVAGEEGLAEYRHFLDNVLRRRPHTLSPREEQLLSLAGEVTSAPYSIYSMLSNADIRFPEITGEDGDKVELSQGRYIRFMQSRSREVRREAYRAMYTTYGKYKNTLAASLNSQIKVGLFMARARNFGSALEAALFEDNIPVAVYDNVVDTINANLAPLHKYVALKKQVLNLDTIAMHDIYAPLVGEAKIDVGFEEAQDMILQALAPLGKDYVDKAAAGFREGWIDAFENRGKRSGAYSSGSYLTKPFILMNYDNTLNSAFTLAHELGHSMHSLYSRSNQPPATAGYPIFTAEVASTLNEALLNHYLLQQTSDPKKRAFIINEYLETIRGTVYRQAMFAEFEQQIYARTEQGEALTGDEFCTMWRELNQRYFGPEMQVDDLIAMEWARIPHFYYNFYVYKYVTGFAAATSLAQQIIAGDKGAVERYLAFLKSGGSDYPLALLKKAGVDMTTPQPLELTLALFDRLLDQLAELL